MLYGNNHKKHYTPSDCDIATFIRLIRSYFGFLPVLMFLSTLSLAPSHFSSLINITLPSHTAPSGGVLYNNNNKYTIFRWKPKTRCVSYKLYSVV